MKKGFTLVELLAVIIVLAIILAIAVPTIGKLIDNSRFNTYKNQQSLLIKAAQLYLSNNTELYPLEEEQSVFIKLSDLIGGNQISNIFDPKDKSTCDTTYSGVKVINNGSGSYQYEPYLNCTNYKADNTAPLITTIVNGNSLKVIGIDENVLSFNGLSDYALVNASFPSVLTIEAWGFAKTINGKMLWSFDSSAYGSGVDLYPQCGTFSLNTGDGCSNPFSNSTFTSLNLWHHYAVVFDQTANVGRLYIDGNLIGTAVYKNPAGSKLYFGRYDNNGYFWDGYIKDLRIWNTVRTESEIRDNMYSKLNGSEVGLISYYKMNEMEGSVLYDLGSNKKDATAYGTTRERNSGVKEIRVKQGATLIASSTQSTYTFTLSAGTYTIEVEDYTGRIATKTVTI